MTYGIFYKLWCNHPDGCTSTWEKSISAPGDVLMPAQALGWYLGDAGDLCPAHAPVLEPASPATNPDLTPVTQLVPAPEAALEPLPVSRLSAWRTRRRGAHAAARP